MPRLERGTLSCYARPLATRPPFPLLLWQWKGLRSGSPFHHVHFKEVPSNSLRFLPNELVSFGCIAGGVEWRHLGQGRVIAWLCGPYLGKVPLSSRVGSGEPHCGSSQNKSLPLPEGQETEFLARGKILALSPQHGKPLAAKFHGPIIVERRVGDFYYMVTTPDRRKNFQLYHKYCEALLPPDITPQKIEWFS